MNKKGQKTKVSEKKGKKQESDFQSLKDLHDAWKNFKPITPLSYVIATSEASRNK